MVVSRGCELAVVGRDQIPKCLAFHPGVFRLCAESHRKLLEPCKSGELIDHICFLEPVSSRGCEGQMESDKK